MMESETFGGGDGRGEREPRRPGITVRDVHGPPTRIGDAEVETVARFGALRLPFGAYVVIKPHAVIVRRGGSEERVPIYDVTWMAFLALLALAVVFWMARWTAARNRG
jgi:hypothetical protein